MTRPPLRVLVWGPGGLGNICIREVLRKAEFELVGVLAYAAEKNGVDAGLLAAASTPAGVAATTELSAALAIETDVVLHLARDFGRYTDLSTIERFLASGRNVITVHPYHHPEAMRLTAATDDTAERIGAACRAGGSTFHATGIHPEWLADRIAPTLTGICSDIRNITIYENWDMSQFNEQTLGVIGFGKDPAAMESNKAVAQMTDNYCLQNLYGLAAGLGVTLERTEKTHQYATAPVELTFPAITVAPGTVGRLTHTWHGFEGTGAHPIVSAEVNWMLGRREMVPVGMSPEHYYGVRIEGTPSVAMDIAIHGSLEGRTRRQDPDIADSEPGYYGAIATCLQAVPRVVTAEPGWLGPTRPELHWTRDFRDLLPTA